MFKKLIESKWKTVEAKIGECLKVKVIANKRNILGKNQMYMKINGSENSHGLIRNIVYFKDKDDQVVNSKIVSQCHIDRKTCGVKEEVEYIAFSNGDSKSQKSFYTIKKVFFQILKANCYIKEKQPQVFCTTIHTKMGVIIETCEIYQDQRKSLLICNNFLL